MLKVGSRVPRVAGTLQDGTPVDLGVASGRPVVVYFYPKAFTPVCTREACSFRAAYAELSGRYGATIFGVSRGSPETHARFKYSYDLPFDLVSDPDGAIARAFGVLYLGGLLPLTKRATFVIDSEGVVRGSFHHEFSAQRHVRDAQRCLEAITRPDTALGA